MLFLFVEFYQKKSSAIPTSQNLKMMANIFLCSLDCAGEKTKWMPVPASELQFTTPDPHSPSHSRTQSQHRRHRQTASRSRQQSQTRTSSNKPQGAPMAGSNPGVAGVGRLPGSHGSSASGELSVSQSRAESTTHSRTTSVHSSPRLHPRGRRLPEDQSSNIYGSLSQIVSSVNEPSAGPSSNAKKPPITVLPNGVITEGTPDIPAPVPIDPLGPQFQPPQTAYVDPSSSPTALRNQNPSVPHSQSHTPYPPHSPLYFHPQPLPQYMYNSGVYGAPPPPPHTFDPQQYPPVHAQSPSGAPGQPHGYHPYPPYHMQPYMFPAPYPYYSHQPHYDPNANALPIQVQGQENKVDIKGGPPDEGMNRVVDGFGNLTVQSPILPPPSMLTHPPPPDRSAALAGYREVSAIPISPLLQPHHPSNSLDAIASGSVRRSERTEQGSAEKKEEMVFGSVGRPGGMKSPSPVPTGQTITASFSSGETQEKQSRSHSRSNTTLTVGVNEQDAERMKSRNKRAKGVPQAIQTESEKIEPQKVGIQAEQQGDSVQAPKYQFGTSSQPEDGACAEDTLPVPQNGDVEGMQAQILQPQPHQPPVLHFHPPFPSHYNGTYMMPPPGVPVNMPITLPLASPSPQSLTQPLPHHVPSLHPYPMNPGFVSPLTLGSPGPNSGGPTSAGPDEFLEVRDFGYGFGPMSGSGYGPERVREERIEREREREREREHHHQQRENFREQRDFFPGRGRRGNGPFDRGFPRRGRGGPGFRSFVRGFGRGGHGGFRHQNQPSLNVSTNNVNNQQPPVPPQAQVQAPPMADSPSGPGPEGYYPPPPSQGSSSFPASPYAMYNPAPLPLAPQPSRPPPPVQPPVTKVTFPLDPLSHNLLGQLEYYFSQDNLPADFFLRSQVSVCFSI